MYEFHRSLLKRVRAQNALTKVVLPVTPPVLLSTSAKGIDLTDEKDVQA